MKIPFFKYQATGNDFILIDNRKGLYQLNEKQVEALCHRHFGIGADGLIFLENHDSLDFKMVYFNSDGKQSTMCGNGGRSIVQFANHLGIVNKEAKFMAIDGEHLAYVLDESIKLQMINVNQITEVPVENRTEINHSNNNSYYLNTGSPHHIEFVKDLDQLDVFTYGREIRNTIYGKEGSNVNFVEILGNNIIKVRTYERGVEDETFSCGTGVTAAAIASHYSEQVLEKNINIISKGGELTVNFDEENRQYSNIFLVGKANRVFNGEISV